MNIRGVSLSSDLYGLKQTEWEGSKERPYFFLCDLLGLSTEVTRDRPSAVDIVEQTLFSELGGKGANNIKESDLLRAIEQANAAVMHNFPFDPPRLSLMVGVLQRLEENNQELLIAIVGDLQLFCCEKQQTRLLYSDPHTTTIPSRLSMQERKSILRHCLGSAAQIHAACQRLPLKESCQYLALSYGVYGSCSPGELSDLALIVDKGHEVAPFLESKRQQEHGLKALCFTCPSTAPAASTLFYHKELQKLRRRTQSTALALTGATCAILALLGYHYLFDAPATIYPSKIAHSEETAALMQLHANELKQLYEDKNGLILRMATAEAELAALRETQQNPTLEQLKLADSLKELEMRNRHLAEERAQLQETLSVITVEKERLLAKGAISTNALQEQLSLEKSLLRVQEDLHQLQEKEKALLHENEALSRKILQAQELLSVSLATTSELEQERERLQKERLSLETEHKQLKQEFTALQHKEEERQTREQLAVTQRDNTLRELKAQVEEQQKALVSLRQSRAALYQELNELKKQNEQVVQQRQQGSTTPVATGVRRYTVRAGDTLSTISEKYYGTSKKWNQIYEANREHLNSPTQIKVGTELIIP